MSYNAQNPDGQATEANSSPVVIASDQSAVAQNLTEVNGTVVATAASGVPKVGVADGTGNAITSTSNALDVNIKSGGSSSAANADEAAWTAGTSTFAPLGGTFNDSATALTSGQQGTARVTSNRGLHANLRSSAGTEIATSGNPLRVDPTGTTTQPVSGTLSVNALPAGTNTIGGVELVDSGGTNKASISAGGAVKVDGSGVTQPVSGTFWQTTQPVSLASLPVLATGSNTIGAISNTSFTAAQTTAANLNATVTPAAGTGAAVPSVAQPAGFQARTSEQSATSNTDNTIAVVDKVGKLIVLPYANPENFVSGTASATGTTSTSVVSAGAAGIKNYITDVLIANTGTVTTLVSIQNGNGGSTLINTIAPAGGGSNIHLAVPIPTSAATAVYFAAGSATTTLYVTVSGYQGV